MTLEIFQRPEVIEACKRFGVKELQVFGSVLEKPVNEVRDIDLIVEFENQGFEGAFDQFMGFKERMEAILGLPVDLITKKRFRNPFFQAEVDRTGEVVYVP